MFGNVSFAKSSIDSGGPARGNGGPAREKMSGEGAPLQLKRLLPVIVCHYFELHAFSSKFTKQLICPSCTPHMHDKPRAADGMSVCVEQDGAAKQLEEETQAGQAGALEENKEHLKLLQDLVLFRKEEKQKRDPSIANEGASIDQLILQGNLKPSTKIGVGNEWQRNDLFNGPLRRDSQAQEPASGWRMPKSSKDDAAKNKSLRQVFEDRGFEKEKESTEPTTPSTPTFVKVFGDKVVRLSGSDDEGALAPIAKTEV
jgi:hypothetical protein